MAWESRNCFANDRDWMGDAAISLYSLFYIVIGAGFFTLVSGVVYVSDGVRQLQAEGHAHATKH